MDTQIIVIALILILIVFSPLLWMNWIRNRKKNDLQKTIQKIVEHNNEKLGESETIGETVFALDQSGKNFYFARKHKKDLTLQTIELAAVANCKVNESTKDVDIAEGHYQIIEQMGMNFTFKDSTRQPLFVSIYTSADKVRLGEEIHLIEKWAKLINKNIR